MELQRYRTTRWFALAVLVHGCRDAPPTNPTGQSEGIDVVEDLRIDGHREELTPIPTLVGSNSGIALLPDGGVAVAQAQDNQIVFYNKRGRRTGVAGRAGAGPGEFRMMMAIGVVADTVWAFDLRLRRVTLIAPGSRYVRSFEMPRIPELKPISEAGAGLIMLGLQTDKSFVAAFMDPDLRLVYSNQDGSTRKILDPPMETSGHFVSQARGRNGNVFDVKAEFVVAPDGKTIGITRPLELSEKTSTVSLTVQSAMGDTVFSRVLEFPPLPIPKSVIDSVVRSRTVGLNRIEMAAFERSAYIPVSLPPVKAGVFGPGGTLWLRQTTASDSQAYMVLDKLGKQIGVVTFPRATIVHAVDVDAVWTVVKDEYDVPSIVRYRIVRAE